MKSTKKEKEKGKRGILSFNSLDWLGRPLTNFVQLREGKKEKKKNRHHSRQSFLF